MTINENSLIKIGFEKRRYRDLEYEELHIGNGKPFQLIFFENKSMYLLSSDICYPLPECKTIEDVQSLIKILNIQ